ncbi:hypothetical protein FGO68_gene9875 [Halteria grandinella]|uniref:Uncharacterized protein n=1 Tax=Halteria grandinella TaxID=5974 RepID=A0A8J8NXM4_HALGN|nr:hypothetical protein FGO68_gene9875 [Halteria grandinella]
MVNKQKYRYSMRIEEPTIDIEKGFLMKLGQVPTTNTRNSLITEKLSHEEMVTKVKRSIMRRRRSTMNGSQKNISSLLRDSVSDDRELISISIQNESEHSKYKSNQNAEGTGNKIQFMQSKPSRILEPISQKGNKAQILDNNNNTDQKLNAKRIRLEDINTSPSKVREALNNIIPNEKHQFQPDISTSPAFAKIKAHLDNLTPLSQVDVKASQRSPYINQNGLLDRSVMLLTKNDKSKRALKNICRKLSISKNEIGPFVVQREGDRIKEIIDQYLEQVEKNIAQEVESARDSEKAQNKLGLLKGNATSKQQYYSVLQSTRNPFDESKRSAAISQLGRESTRIQSDQLSRNGMSTNNYYQNSQGGIESQIGESNLERGITKYNIHRRSIQPKRVENHMMSRLSANESLKPLSNPYQNKVPSKTNLKPNINHNSALSMQNILPSVQIFQRALRNSELVRSMNGLKQSQYVNQDSKGSKVQSQIKLILDQAKIAQQKVPLRKLDEQQDKEENDNTIQSASSQIDSSNFTSDYMHEILQVYDQPFDEKAKVWQINELLSKSYQEQRNDYYLNRKRKNVANAL